MFDKPEERQRDIAGETTIRLMARKGGGLSLLCWRTCQKGADKKVHLGMLFLRCHLLPITHAAKYGFCTLPGQASVGSDDGLNASLNTRHSRILSYLFMCLSSSDFGNRQTLELKQCKI